MRKTNNLQIVKSDLHRTAGPYKWVKSVILGVLADGGFAPNSDENSDLPSVRD